jgi:hypothetical protein
MTVTPPVAALATPSDLVELVLGTHGRSAGQHDAWASVFGPVGEDGYYKPLYDKLTGAIDHRLRVEQHNIGNHAPVAVNELVRQIEQATGRAAIRESLPMQPGEMMETCADVAALEVAIGFRPSTELGQGVGNSSVGSVPTRPEAVARFFPQEQRVAECG